MVEIKILTAQTIDAGSEVSYSESINIDGNNIENYIAKVYNWTGENLKPLSKVVVISGSKADFYGNSVTNATLIQDFNKEVQGLINAIGDVDYFKIIPTNTRVYTLKTFSTSNVVGTLYDSEGNELVSEASSIEYSLNANSLYYIKLSNFGVVGDYIFTISNAADFDIYKFDMDINVYKNSIIEICNDLYYEDKSLSKQMYSEFEDILDDDAKLHTLPDFLAEHPKDISNFDDLLNEYYGTKYDSFEEIKQRYISLIDKYTEVSETSDVGADEIEEANADLMTESIETARPILGRSVPTAKRKDSIEVGPINPGDQTQQTPTTPSLTIVSTTETSVTYNVIFPVSGQWGNTICIIDFNTDDGLTIDKNAHRGDMYRDNGQYIISGLKPGGIYVLYMTWSADDNLFGGENSICRFVQLPDNSSENLTLYSGGRVTARMEAEDKALASSLDFNLWLDRMDKAYYAYKELTGYTPYSSKKIEMRSTRENLNDLFEVTDGQNYSEVIFGYYDETNIFKYSRVFYQGHMRRLSMGDWGYVPMHELSHVFDIDRWNFDVETLAQFKLCYVVEQLDAKFYEPGRYENSSKGWYTGEDYYELLKHDRYLESYDMTFGNGIYGSEGFAAILIEIQREIGWEPFKKTFRYFSNLSSSQVLYDEGEILKLFLTKLKDYSGEDVLGMISNYDTEIIEDWYGITLEYVEPIYPTVTESGAADGGTSDINVDKGSYSMYQFTPTESANYYIYTSPYGGSGVSNDTYIEVYDNASLSGTPLASNDDYDGGRFSKVSVAMTDGTTYYIKVRHYSNGQLHAELNITENVPVVELSPDEYEEVRVTSGEFALYSYTPSKSTTYVFEVGNYEGGTSEYDTYIKLYGNESMTERMGHGSKKILANLNAGQTYYLQFSGFLMRSSRGRISVREGQTIEFTKRTDSSFIYVNNPEYITNRDIVDDETTNLYGKLKIFEQQNITGENTYYEPHLVWWGEYEDEYFPIGDFYFDIDFYNPTSQSIVIDISNLTYLSESVQNSYEDAQKYLNGQGVEQSFVIQPGEHKLLFKDIIGDSYKIVDANSELVGWDRAKAFFVLFDFVVQSGNIIISSLAAYNEENLRLADNSSNTLLSGGELNHGDIIYQDRANEGDIEQKYKGIARGQSAWIDAEIDVVIDGLSNIPLNLYEPLYQGIVDDNTKNTWKTNLNPVNDDSDGLHLAIPSNLHTFEYRYDNEHNWNFDFRYSDLNVNCLDFNGTSEDSINMELPNCLNVLAEKVRSREENTSALFPDSLGISSWGATYHYMITATNICSEDKVLEYNIANSSQVITGYKLQGETIYTTEYVPKLGNDEWYPVKSVTVPAGQTVTFEIVTLLVCGDGGLHNKLIVR